MTFTTLLPNLSYALGSSANGGLTNLKRSSLRNRCTSQNARVDLCVNNGQLSQQNISSVLKKINVNCVFFSPHPSFTLIETL
jgi:hypothetical protein